MDERIHPGASSFSAAFARDRRGSCAERAGMRRRPAGPRTGRPGLDGSSPRQRSRAHRSAATTRRAAPTATRATRQSSGSFAHPGRSGGQTARYAHPYQRRMPPRSGGLSALPAGLRSIKRPSPQSHRASRACRPHVPRALHDRGWLFSGDLVGTRPIRFETFCRRKRRA